MSSIPWCQRFSILVVYWYWQKPRSIIFDYQLYFYKHFKRVWLNSQHPTLTSKSASLNTQFSLQKSVYSQSCIAILQLNVSYNWLHPLVTCKSFVCTLTSPIYTKSDSRKYRRETNIFLLKTNSVTFSFSISTKLQRDKKKLTTYKWNSNK